MGLTSPEGTSVLVAAETTGIVSLSPWQAKKATMTNKKGGNDNKGGC